MSYAKAMKHWRNVKKCRKMSRGHYLCVRHELTPEEIKKIKAYQRKLEGK